MTRHPDNPDAFTLPPADRAILRRALQSRLNELGRLVASMRGALVEDSAAVMEEMRAVGAMMESVRE